MTGVLKQADSLHLGHGQPPGPYVPEGPALPANIEGDPITLAHAEFRNADGWHRKHLDHVHTVEEKNNLSDRPTRTDAGFDEMRKSFGDRPCVAACDVRMAAVDAYANEAAAQVACIRDGMKAGDDAGSQIQAQRTWARTKPVLDAADGGKVIAEGRQRIADADAVQLATYAEEMPDYYAARGLPTDWIDADIASKAPGLGEAMQRARDIRLQRDTINFNHQKLTREFKGGYRSGVELVDPTTIAPLGNGRR
jgi:hypothetical protein